MRVIYTAHADRLLPAPQGAQAAGVHARAPDAARGAGRARDLAVDRRLLHAVARVLRQGRAALRPLRPRVRHLLQGRRRDLRHPRRDSRGVAAQGVRALPDRRGQEAVEAMGGWDKLMETLKKRLEEQRGRHQGGNKWIGTGGTSPFGAYGYNPEGVRIGQDGGGSRSAVKVWDERSVPQPRRRRRAQHAQHQGRAAPAAQLRARRRARRARPPRHHRGHRAQRGLARPAHAARAPQPRQGAAVPRRRRLDGPARARVRGALLRGEGGVPPPRVFLFPQLRVRPRVARQRPPPQRALSHPRAHPHLRAGLEGRSSSAMPR